MNDAKLAGQQKRRTCACASFVRAMPENVKPPANVGYSWGIIRVGSLLPTRFSFPHAILMRFNPNRIVAN